MRPRMQGSKQRWQSRVGSVSSSLLLVAGAIPGSHVTGSAARISVALKPIDSQGFGHRSPLRTRILGCGNWSPQTRAEHAGWESGEALKTGSGDPWNAGQAGV